MSDRTLRAQALHYHRQYPSGKLLMLPAKPCTTPQDLSLAYSPGVAFPCEEIQRDPGAAYLYTTKGNTVGVITNGTAVLGLGDIGPLASLPVMEGKCMLLQQCAGINGVPLALRVGTSEAFIAAVLALEPSLGAINLEDIKAPECFAIEQQLQERLSIPVMHDDQHGTAILVVAALLGSLTVVKKSLQEVTIVINGAGSAGIATAQLLVAAGVRHDQLLLLDRYGVISTDRLESVNAYKKPFMQQTAKKTLSQALKGADVFIGVSKGNMLTESMMRDMNRDAIIFALANPEPEVIPEQAKAWGVAVIATGRSDYPNQVNNALGFPGIFRAVLDVRARRITIGMKLAAVRALHRLTTMPFPDAVKKKLAPLYPLEEQLGIFQARSPLSASYIIPKLFDPRLVPLLARAVAEAAHQDGVAQEAALDWEVYEQHLAQRPLLTGA